MNRYKSRNKGWAQESERHSLAARSVRTGRKNDDLVIEDMFGRKLKSFRADIGEEMGDSFTADQIRVLKNINFEYYADQNQWSVPSGKRPDTGMTELQFVQNQLGLSQREATRLVSSFLDKLEKYPSRSAMKFLGYSEESLSARGKHFVAGFKDQKTFKTVSYGDKDFKPYSDGLAVYKGRMYGTKEDLKYFPKKVRLVELEE